MNHLDAEQQMFVVLGKFRSKISLKNKSGIAFLLQEPRFQVSEIT